MHGGSAAWRMRLADVPRWKLKCFVIEEGGLRVDNAGPAPYLDLTGRQWAAGAHRAKQGVGTMERTINLPETVTFRRAGYDMTVPMESLPDHILAELVAHGLAQTIGDAASAATSGVYESGRTDGEPDWKALPKADKSAFAMQNALRIAEFGAALMAKRLERLQAGEWTAARVGGGGLSEEEERCARFVADRMDFPKGTKIAEKVKAGWARFGELADAKRDKVMALVRDEIAAERAAAERAAKVAAALDLGDL